MPSAFVTYRSLYESDVVSVSDYSCRGRRGDPAVEEQSGGNTVVLIRRGSFCKHLGKRSVTADVNQAVFFSKGSTYRISHPADCGDRGTVFSLAEGVLGDIVRELDPGSEEHPERPFPFATGPCGPEVFSGHREVVRRLSAADPGPGKLDPLWVDAASLQLVAGAVKAAFDRHGPSGEAKAKGHGRGSCGPRRGCQDLPREPARRPRHAPRSLSGGARVAVSSDPGLQTANRDAHPPLSDTTAPARLAGAGG